MKSMNSFFQKILYLFRPKSHKGKVTFIVTGKPSNFNITYECSFGHACQEADMSSGWTKSIRACNGDFVYCSAQANKKAASLTVEIFYKGKLFRSSTGKGDYATVIASGILV